jgi:heme exporter protein C
VTATAVPADEAKDASATTGSPATRVLGFAVLVGLVAVLLFALVFSPPEQDQGDAVRLLYLHVPTVALAYVSFTLTAVGSAMYLWKKSQWWDLVAHAAAELGVLFTGLTLVVGMLWARPIWGVYWTWDARVTTTALLFLLYLGYLAVRGLAAAPEVRSRRAAWVGLIAFVDLPIVHWSVSWWRSLHQGSTFGIDTQMNGLMLFTTGLSVVVFFALWLWLMVHRFRVAYLETQLESRGLEIAIAERRAEGDSAATQVGL